MLQRKKDERNRSAELFLNDLVKTGIMHLDMEQQLFDHFKVISEEICNLAQKAIDDHINFLNSKERKDAPAYVCWCGCENISRYGLLEHSFHSIGGYERFGHLDWKGFHAEIKQNLVDTVFRKDLEEFVINIVKDDWAFWLDSVQEKINQSTNIKVLDSLRDELDKHFSEKRQQKINCVTDLLALTKMPEQQLRLARIFLLQVIDFFYKSNVIIVVIIVIY